MTGVKCANPLVWMRSERELPKGRGALATGGWPIKVQTSHVPLSSIPAPTGRVTNNRPDDGVSTLPDHGISENR
ncbi:hypothetical protein BDV32DRAFT_7401 [Aspergillus pseudonomiae]|nr:hypothetical protein BDV32DRAFT_7401 [Aspergillus pseudonomiae]